MAGLRTKADAVTSFDDLTVTQPDAGPLKPANQVGERDNSYNEGDHDGYMKAMTDPVPIPQSRGRLYSAGEYDIQSF